MEDRDVALLVAADLERYLRQRAGELDGPVYGLALWADDVYGTVGIGIGTEAAYRRRVAVPAFADGRPIPRGIGGLRWSSGEWDHIVEPFLTDETENALRPLADILNDGDADEALVCFTAARWREIAYFAVRNTQLPAELATTPDLLLWAEHGEASIHDRAQIMLRCVPPERFHATFPEWRQMAQAVRELESDPARWPALRDEAAKLKEQGYPSKPLSEVLAAGFQADLEACGLGWFMLAEGAGHSILEIAAVTTRLLPRPCPEDHATAPALD